MKLFNINIKKNTVVYTWLISYLLIFLVPITISGVIYFISMNEISKVITLSNEKGLDLVQKDIDVKLQQINQKANEIGFDASVQMFSSFTSPISSSERQILHSITSKLRQFVTVYPFITNVYICYDNSQMVANYYSPLEMYEFYNTMKINGIDKFSDWKDMVFKKNRNTYFPVSIKNNNNYSDNIAYICPISIGSNGGASAVCIVTFDAKMLLNDVALPINTVGVAIINPKNEIVASTISEPIQFKYDDLGQEYYVHNFKLNNQDYVMMSLTSKISHFRYVLVTSFSSFWISLTFVRTIIIVSLIICFVLAAFATRFFIKKNYFPINKLITDITNLSGKGKNENETKYEYDILIDAIENAFEEKKKIDKRLNENNNVIKSDVLRKLLIGKYSSNIPIEKLALSKNIEFPYPNYVVVLFNVNDIGVLSTWDEMDDNGIINVLELIIPNVFEELVADFTITYTVGIDNMFASIVNISCDGDLEAENRIFNCIDQTLSFFKKEFDIMLDVTVSNVVNNMNEICIAYSQTIDAMEYKFIKGKSIVIKYSEIANLKGNSTIHYYPLNVEQQLVNTIKIGDNEAAQLILNEIFEKNLDIFKVSIVIARILMIDITSTILKTLDEIDETMKTNFINDLINIEDLLKITTVDELKDKIINDINKVCDFINKSKKNNNSKRFEDIIKYIKENYSDSNLCVASVGDYFDCSPYYLSKMFKEHTGEGLSDFISRIRIEEARVLLLQTNESIISITNKVGYNDAYTFTRVFKKLIGVNPSKFRELKKINLN